MSNGNADYEPPKLWVIVHFGEVWGHTYSEEEALDIARHLVDQTIADHWSHLLPMQVTPEIARGFDVQVYRCASSSLLKLPLQQWTDENYQYRQKSEAHDENMEYKRYVQLREKYEPRFQKEASMPSLDHLRDKESVCSYLLRTAKEDEETFNWYAERDHSIKGFQWYQAAQQNYVVLTIYMLGKLLYDASFSELDRQIQKALNNEEHPTSGARD